MSGEYDPNSFTYTLPAPITALVGGRSKMATAMVVTSALFASIGVSLAQLADQNDQGATGVALRIILYSGIGSNLISAACSFWTISAVSQMPYISQLQAMRNSDSWSFKAGKRDDPPNPMSIGEHQLLRNFGLEKAYKWQIIGGVLWFLLGLLLDLVALIIYIWSSQPLSVSITVTALLTPGLLGASLPIFPVVVQFLWPASGVPGAAGAATGTRTAGQTHVV